LHSEIKKTALDKIDLLERVAKHKSFYFASTWANYGKARKGSLKLCPPNRILKELEKDYVLMKAMFFRETPQWKVILKTIEEFEKSFNTINSSP
jgi:hypothetical protein